MGNIFDQVPVAPPLVVIIKYECKGGHIHTGDSPPRICSECDAHWTHKYYNDMRTDIKRTLDNLLGMQCACCGSRKRLQIDHVFGRSKEKDQGSILKQIFERPKDFQRLCRDCNRWKNNGPCCPCRYWDAAYPGWRKL